MNNDNIHKNSKSWREQLQGIPAVSFLFVLVLHGAIPFITIPTLGQAIWLTGFAQSFANNSFFSIYATNFGYPAPAAIALGLCGAYPVSIFIQLGLHPADAYALMNVLWLFVSFLGTWKICRSYFNLHQGYASTLSILWLSLPIVWGHAGYSVVAIGIGLLPFYFWTALNLFSYDNFHIKSPKYKLYHPILLYIFSTLVSVFMDGYSFMMFAVASSFLGFYQLLINDKKHHRTSTLVRLSIHLSCFALAYFLYVLYTGKTQFSPSHLDVFRGWGVDLLFLIIPTEGIHWLWDILNVSESRIPSEQFGDSSVWKTTYSFPLITIGCVAWWRTHKNSKLATIFLIIAFFGLYMSLGPSLKINAVRPNDIPFKTMPVEYSMFSTGNGWLSKNIPGFQNMRAAYRWLALACLGFWLLLILLINQEKSKLRKRFILIACLLLIISSLPNLPKHLARQYQSREAFFDIEEELVADIKDNFKENELVAFLPYGNDFLANYITSRTNIRAYNIGGDKNLREAKKSWPYVMSGFKVQTINNEFSDRLTALLYRREVDVVILPFIDLLQAAHQWPVQSHLSEKIRLIVEYLNDNPFLTTEMHTHYATVRLDYARLQKSKSQQILDQTLESDICIVPTCLEYDPSNPTSEILTQVGESIRNTGVQSTSSSGFLAFGPYSELEPGDYELQVEGIAENSIGENITIDVVSNKGQNILASFQDISNSSNQSGIPSESNLLVDQLVKVTSNSNDVEVRIYVDEQAYMLLTSYRLKKLKA